VVPGGVPAERRTALLAVASHRTVRNTLRQEPGIAIDLAWPRPVLAGGPIRVACPSGLIWSRRQAPAWCRGQQAADWPRAGGGWSLASVT
jgi:hypothetical protein